MDKNKFIKNIFLVSIVIGVFLFGSVSFIIGQNFDSLFKNNGNSKPIVVQSQSEKRVIIDEESATVNVVSSATPSVVSIVISKDLPKYYTYSSPFDSEVFGDFGNVFGQKIPSKETEKKQIGGGTGFIISEDGLVATNKHVVEDTSASYSVLLSNGNTYDLDVLARDPFNDFAICKIKNLKDKIIPLKLGDSSNIKLGQTVIAIGNALGEFNNTVTKGIVSGLGRKITAGGTRSGAETLSNIIQTDAAISSGNSGGPLLNLSGEVVGINTAVSSEGQNIGFAININSIKNAVDSVKKTGKISRPYIGIRYMPINATIAKDNNLKYDYGVMVLRGRGVNDLAIIKDSPADKAGVMENDIILEVGDKKITDGDMLANEISSLKVGDSIRLKIARGDKVLDIKIVLDEMK